MDEYREIPDHLLESLDGYLRYGHDPGSGLSAILRNDLMETFRRCDDQTLMVLPLLARYIYNSIPAAAWGSDARVERWRQRSRLWRATVVEQCYHPTYVMTRRARART